MQFASYTDFRNAVIRMIDGDDVTASTLSLDTIDLLIGLGESRVYLGDEGVPGLRSRDMEATLSVALSSNAATIPSDCLELVRVQFSGEPPLPYASDDAILRDLDAGGGGSARYYTREGNSLVFYPTTSGTVGGRYFKRPADIKTGGLHATFNRYPECFLYAALAEAAPFIGEDGRLPMWKAQWAGWMNRANAIERNTAPAGARLTMRAR